jgi:UDP-N-acetylenolpyruvoylglucosamine reductase
VKIIGNGSNLLAADKGVRGAVIRLTPNFAGLSRDGSAIIAGSGAKLGRALPAQPRQLALHRRRVLFAPGGGLG